MRRAQIRRGRWYSGRLPGQVRFYVIADYQQRFRESLLLGVVVRRHSTVAMVAISAGRSSVISGNPVRGYGRDAIPHEAIQVVLRLIQFRRLRIALEMRHAQRIGRGMEM